MDALNFETTEEGTSPTTALWHADGRLLRETITSMQAQISAMAAQLTAGASTTYSPLRPVSGFPGSTPDDRLTNAYNWAKSRGDGFFNYVPGILMDEYLAAYYTQRQWFNGLTLCDVWQFANRKRNDELNSSITGNGDVVPTFRIRYLGTGSWWSNLGATATVYDVHMAPGVVINTAGTSTLYSGILKESIFYSQQPRGFRNSIDLTLTDCDIVGAWTGSSHQSGIPYKVKGSDGNYWVEGSINLGAPGAAGTYGNGRPQLWVEGEKQTFGAPYMTCRNGYLGLYCAGNGANNSFTGIRSEGRNFTEACDGAVVIIDGGQWTFYSGHFNYYMKNPSMMDSSQNSALWLPGGKARKDRGAIMQYKGHSVWREPTFDRASGVPWDMPILTVLGGTVDISGVMVADEANQGWGGKPIVLNLTGNPSAVRADSTVQVLAQSRFA